MITAAIYARKSTDQNGVAADAKSVTRQIEHAKAYAAAHGWTVSDAHVFVDDGFSGALRLCGSSGCALRATDSNESRGY